MDKRNKWTRGQEIWWWCIRLCIWEMTYTDYMYQEKKEDNPPALNIAYMYQYEKYKDCIKKSKEKFITATRNRTYNIKINWTTITRCPWCNGYRRRKCTRRRKFKSWTRLIAFNIALIPLGKVWIQLFSLQLWVNNRTDYVLQPWWDN